MYLLLKGLQLSRPLVIETGCLVSLPPVTTMETSPPLHSVPAETPYSSVRPVHSSSSVSVPIADVCLCQVPVHLRPGQEEAFPPAAAALLRKQTGSGFVPEPNDQSHLQTLAEETVHEEC